MKSLTHLLNPQCEHQKECTEITKNLELCDNYHKNYNEKNHLDCYLRERKMAKSFKEFQKRTLKSTR